MAQYRQESQLAHGPQPIPVASVWLEYLIQERLGFVVGP